MVAVSPHTQAVAGTAVPVPAAPRPPTNLPAVGFRTDWPRRRGSGRACASPPPTAWSPGPGAGGIGETCLGLEVARRLLPKFADGVWVIELAPLSDPDLVPAAVATALGLDPAHKIISPERVANALAAKGLGDRS
jgi:hypothetical protein